MRSLVRRNARSAGGPVDPTRGCRLVAAAFLVAYLSIVAAAVWIAVSPAA